jgi:hypothetical protein
MRSIQKWTERVTPEGQLPSVVEHEVDTLVVEELLPGSPNLATMPDQSVLSLGGMGEVYLDGRRLGAARVAKLVRVGVSIYGRGATDGQWYRWTGTGWVVQAQVDTNLLQV